MREYVVGYYNKGDFVILATMDSKNVAIFVRDSYNEGYKMAGLPIKAVSLASYGVPKNYRFAKSICKIS